MIIRTTNHISRGKGLSYLLIAFLVLITSCMERNSDKKQENKRLVYDYGEFLNSEEANRLEYFLDSIREKRDLNLIYFSVANFEKLNADSLAEMQFKKLSIAKKGGLIFLSRGTSSSKILVGQDIHNKISDSELSKITRTMTPFFKNMRFFDGVKFGFTEMITKMDKTQND